MLRLGSSRARLNMTQRRSMSYSLPVIKTLDQLREANKDFYGLYSSNTIDELWFKRGNSLVEGLNQMLEDNNVSDRPVDLNQLISKTFNKPDLYGVHAYASLLHNLQFHFESLKPNDETAHRQVKQYGSAELLATPAVKETYNNEPSDPELRDWIVSSFGSIGEFRTLLLNSAKGIKGDGSVWLVAQALYNDKTGKQVQNQFSKLAIMNTYNAGFVNDSIRSGQVSKLQQQKEAKAEFLKREQQEAGTYVEPTDLKVNELELGTVEEAESATLYMNRKLIPLLAIDASSRNYLLDYGVFGKQRYLDNVWDCIDWTIVQQRAPKRFKPTIENL